MCHDQLGLLSGTFGSSLCSLPDFSYIMYGCFSVDCLQLHYTHSSSAICRLTCLLHTNITHPYPTTPLLLLPNRLVHLITSREKTLECIQYLQSLRAIVDCPPPTPTRSLAKTKAPSIDKVSVCSVCGGGAVVLVFDVGNSVYSFCNHIFSG